MKSPAEIAVKYEAVGKGKTELPVLKTFLLGILAGAFIALGGLGMAVFDKNFFNCILNFFNRRSSV